MESVSLEEYVVIHEMIGIVSDVLEARLRCRVLLTNTQGVRLNIKAPTERPNVAFTTYHPAAGYAVLRLRHGAHKRPTKVWFQGSDTNRHPDELD